MVNAFADADVFDRNLELVGDADDHAALGSAVELRQRKGIDFSGGSELLGLLDSILSRGGIQHKQDFMRSIRNDLLHDGLDLSQLAHEVDLVVQTASGVDDDYISILCHRRLHRVESHGSGVGALTLLDARHAYPIRPNLQLTDGSGTEGIGSAEHDLLARLLEVVRQLADGGGLAHTVHAYYQYDIGLMVGR